MPKAFSTVSAGFFHGSISSFTAIAEDCGKPARVRLLKKRWLLPSSSFLAGLLVIEGERCGEGEQRKPLVLSNGRTAPLAVRLSLHTALPLAVQFQRLNNGIFDFLRGRPRRKIPADPFLWDFDLFLLIGLLLLHNG